MIILGIDPGTKRMGFGLVEVRGPSLVFIAAGLIGDSEGKPVSLLPLKKHLDSLFKKHAPEIVAIERLYFSKNQKTAISVAEARGVALLAAEEHGARVLEYSPTEAKSRLTGYGGADKTAVAKMVRLILKEPDLNLIDDACDALALAIVAASDPKIKTARSYRQTGLPLPTGRQASKAEGVGGG